jgi:hypothetical protein
LLGVIELRSASGFLSQEVIYISEYLFKHMGKGVWL